MSRNWNWIRVAISVIDIMLATVTLQFKAGAVQNPQNVFKGPSHALVAAS